MLNGASVRSEPGQADKPAVNGPGPAQCIADMNRRLIADQTARMKRRVLTPSHAYPLPSDRGAMATHVEGGQQTRRREVGDIPGTIVPAIAGRAIRFLCGRAATDEIPPHSHGELQITVLFDPAICVMQSVAAEKTIESITVHGPAVIMVGPRHVHGCSWQREGNAIVLYLSQQLHQRLLPDGVHGLTVTQASGVQDLLLWQFATIFRELCVSNTPSEIALLHLVAESLATRAVDVIGREQPEIVRSLAPVLLRKVEEFVRAQLPYDIHVDDLAKCAGYSVPHFSMLFKAAKGITPADYLFRSRMHRAEELLRTGNHFIGEVAKLVGYLDQGHFTSLFREFFGYPPKAVIREIMTESSNRPKIT
jgi:AraC-like DNA-binding protein